jgi:hypothetical protein
MVLCNSPKWYCSTLQHGTVELYSMVLCNSPNMVLLNSSTPYYETLQWTVQLSLRDMQYTFSKGTANVECAEGVRALEWNERIVVHSQKINFWLTYFFLICRSLTELTSFMDKLSIRLILSLCQEQSGVRNIFWTVRTSQWNSNMDMESVHIFLLIWVQSCSIFLEIPHSKLFIIIHC